MLDSLRPLRQKIKNALGKGWCVEKYTARPNRFFRLRIYRLGKNGSQDYNYKASFVIDLDYSVPISGLFFEKEIEIIRKIIRKYFTEKAAQ